MEDRKSINTFWLLTQLHLVGGGIGGEKGSSLGLGFIFMEVKGGGLGLTVSLFIGEFKT